mmetsp:Transcript_22234/g.34108  ORF Transcript_22234/g.34108 Transcript_22234/m.34108 type:complete len:107 (+) Transcript_22234:570-890(+)
MMAMHFSIQESAASIFSSFIGTVILWGVAGGGESITQRSAAIRLSRLRMAALSSNQSLSPTSHVDWFSNNESNWFTNNAQSATSDSCGSHHFLSNPILSFSTHMFS